MGKYKSRTLTADNENATDEQQLKEIETKLASNNYEWAIITGQHDFPPEASIHDTEDDLLNDLGNALTCHCIILAIYHKNRLLTDSEEKALTDKAINGLAPISKSRVTKSF